MTEREKTRLVHMARPAGDGRTQGVNPPLIRASTVLYPSTAHQRDIVRRRTCEPTRLAYEAPRKSQAMESRARIRSRLDSSAARS